VLLHAIADALLGAAALGDIGQHFPVGDPAWAGAESRAILRQTVKLLNDRGWRPVNVDATVIAEAPQIGPRVPEMRQIIAECAGLDVGAVSVKATTNETLGALGRREGIAALATAMIQRDEDEP
jgi:2-C-methyl-D-erythritol 2,4-cyclodiphosphate synthase